MPRSKKRPEFVKTMDDKTWDNATLRERFVHVARSQEGVAEFPRGSNWGPSVQAYLKVAGIVRPAAWCMAYLMWCLLQAGADPRKLPPKASLASTYWVYRWAVATNRLDKRAERGDMAIVNRATGGHTWAVLQAGEPHPSLEGNTNPGGSREGYGVFERKRFVADMKKYPRWGFVSIGDDLF